MKDDPINIYSQQNIPLQEMQNGGVCVWKKWQELSGAYDGFYSFMILTVILI